MRRTEAVRKIGRIDGLTLNGVLIVVGVLLAASAVLFWTNRYIVDNTRRDIDTERMRQIYVALTLYESTDNGLPPPDLTRLRRDLGDDDWYRSVNDPWSNGQQPPLDPAFPGVAPSAPFRISFTYLPMWTKYGRVSVANWKAEEKRVHIGILASYWYGSIDRIDPDGRNCTGPIVRINMDGSARTVERRDKHELTAHDLFGIGR